MRTNPESAVWSIVRVVHQERRGVLFATYKIRVRGVNGKIVNQHALRLGFAGVRRQRLPFAVRADEHRAGF